jgi:polar amino acid transport system substrate-binding protein
MTIGGVAWTPDREVGGLLTEPPYYSPPALAVAAGKKYRTVKDLEGRRLATVEGYVWVEAIDAVPRAELGTYRDAKGVFDDLGRGRIDAGFLDPLLIIMRALIEKWGGDPNQFLKPSPESAKLRRGVDRPLDWQPPSI